MTLFAPARSIKAVGCALGVVTGARNLRRSLTFANLIEDQAGSRGDRGSSNPVSGKFQAGGTSVGFQGGQVAVLWTFGPPVLLSGHYPRVGCDARAWGRRLAGWPAVFVEQARILAEGWAR